MTNINLFALLACDLLIGKSGCSASHETARLAKQVITRLGKIKMRPIACISILLLASAAHAAPVFLEHFESDLSSYAGKGGGSHSGLIVQDPLGMGRVLTFTQLASGGDMFTAQKFEGGSYVLEFDYLGTCTSSDCGGFIGYSYDLYPDLDILVYPDGDAEWVGGTRSPYPDLLPDLGSWVHVVIPFTTTQSIDFHLMFEDFVSSNDSVGDVFFDNVSLTPAEVPLPGTLGLLGVGLAGLGFVRRRAT